MVGFILLESWGWLGLIIGSFSRAGRVVGMPRVPDGRAGWCSSVGAVGRGWLCW